MGILAVIVSALLVGANLWLVGGALEPIVRNGRGVEYVLVSPSFARLAVDVAGAAAALLLLQALLVRRRDNPRGPFLSAAHTRHLRPLGWMGLSLLPLANLFGPLAGRFPALSYMAFDLRFFWWPVVLAGVLRAAGLPGPGATVWRRGAARRWAVASLIAIPIAAAVAFTPHLRFTGVLDGDEPKYIRFCENFYQGLAFDISNHRLLTELAPGYEPHVLDNFRRLLGAIPEEAALLAGDARRLVGASAPPRLGANADMFFPGKHPGTVYQLHGPGLSFLLFPGYYLDRRVTGSGLGYQNEFPAAMPAVNMTLLALYAGYALALHGLLAAYGVDRLRAWLLALVGAVAMPAGAFAFQIYPEIAAGLIVFAVVRELIAPRRGAAGAFAFGLLAGFLPWLHVRFGLATVLLVAWMLTTAARPRRARLSFAAGAAVALGCFSLYTYRLTGALLPSAPFGPGQPLSVAHIVNGVPGFAFDRVFGLFPHAPVYLLALPGIGLAWRRRPAVASWMLALIAAVALTAASHGYQAAGATPDRYLVAVAPLLLLFVAEAMAAWGARPFFRAALAASILLSIETAVRYNLHHLKGVGPLAAGGFSGWRLNLLFPSIGTELWPAAPQDVSLLIAWGVVSALLLSIPWWPVWRSRPATGHARLSSIPLGHLFGTLLAVGLLGNVVALFTGETMPADYFVPYRDARERALAAFASVPRCALCYSSAFGAVDPTVPLGNEAAFVDLRTQPASPRAGQPVAIRVRPRSPAGEYIVGLIRLEFGDGETTSHRRLFGDADDRHVYAAPGDYEIHAWVEGSSERTAEARTTIHVAP